MTKEQVSKASEQKTRSGIELQDVYPSKAYALGEPGEFPYLRGIQKDMYRGRLWTMRQYAGFGTAKESNERYRYLLANGTTGLSIAFDLPTQLGLDPDHPRARGEVGKVGVSVSTLEDVRVLFHNIRLDQVSTSMTINATASVLLGFYVALAEEQGAKIRDLRGTVQNDVLKEYVARGNYIYPPQASLRVATDMFDWCSKHLPKWNPISISGYHIREAGSTAVQELAFTFGDAITYVGAALERGLGVDAFAGQLSFFFNAHNDFFEEIAKFRAARRIWAKIMKDRFGAKDPRSQMLRFHTQTGGSTLTAQQPENNVVRVAYQALAAVLGGTQSLHTNSMDEALALPTERSARVALRTQQIIASETGVTHVVDPMGGCALVEELTDSIETRVMAYLQEIDRRGGMVKCIESGYVQNEIAHSAYQDQRAIDDGELQVVGVNCFADAGGTAGASMDLQRVAAHVERDAVEQVKAYRQRRTPAQFEEAKRSLQDGVQGAGNVQELMLAAVKSGLTLGEASEVLRKVFGVHQEYAGF